MKHKDNAKHFTNVSYTIRNYLLKYILFSFVKRNSLFEKRFRSSGEYIYSRQYSPQEIYKFFPGVFSSSSDYLISLFWLSQMGKNNNNTYTLLGNGEYMIDLCVIWHLSIPPSYGINNDAICSHEYIMRTPLSPY